MPGSRRFPARTSATVRSSPESVTPSVAARSSDHARSCGAATGVGETSDQQASVTWRDCRGAPASPGRCAAKWCEYCAWENSRCMAIIAENVSRAVKFSVHAGDMRTPQKIGAFLQEGAAGCVRTVYRIWAISSRSVSSSRKCRISRPSASRAEMMPMGRCL